MTLQQFLQILRARYLIILITFLGTTIGITIISLVLPKQYTASASVVVDVKSPDPLSGVLLQGMIGNGYMATLVDIINSDRVAKSVVKSLNLESDIILQRQWENSKKGDIKLIDWIVASLQSGLDVRPARESNVININYTGLSSKNSEIIANAFAQAAIDVNLDLRVAPARQYALFFDEQTKNARKKLELAQKALSDYQQINGITSSDERVDFETTKLNETSSQLTTVQGLTIDSQSKRYSKSADTVFEVMQSPLITSLKTDIARLEGKLNDSNINLGKNHPQTLRAESELATLKNQLEFETRKITTSIETTYQINKQREAQLQASLLSQKSRVLLLNKQRDELNVLRHDIESAEKAFDNVSLRASQSNIESKTNQTNIALLNSAIAPQNPSKPRVFLNILVSIFLGTFLGIGLALISELINRHIRSLEDMSHMLGIPVLGTISSTSKSFEQTSPNHGAGV